MYSLRLVTPLGDLDHIHQEKFDKFKTRTIEKYRDCPSCHHALRHFFDLYTSDADQLMVKIEFYCNGCSYSKRLDFRYRDIIGGYVSI
jgi:C4-type Zn-finger protein